jgi:OPA family glycerol-3-phosphate transporter-like MFS transporter
VIGPLKPPSHQAPLPPEKVNSAYRRLRLQVFLGIFIGYAGYYLVRRNFTLAMPDLIELGYSKYDLGLALSGVSIAYGLSKFVMGSVSDRSNARVFMALGLACSAAVMIFMGTVPVATSSVAIMFALLLLNGWFQGMGWPPSGRVMAHWFSPGERGTKMAIWNVAHNIGGGLVGPLAILLVVRDTPQSQGLPAIELHRNDYPKAFDYDPEHEKEFSTKQIFVDYVLRNKLLWFIAVANAFVYFVRYGVLDWAPTYLGEVKRFSFEDPTYLGEVKRFSFEDAGWAYAFYEFAGIPGTLLAGWMSDKVFNGRRAPASILFMLATLVCVVVYWLNPAGHPRVDIAMLIGIGFFVYGPVMLIGVHALDLAPKKAAGTAAGFTGLFGYVGGAVGASVIIGYVVDASGWNAGFALIIGACITSMILLALTMRHSRHA